MQQKAANAELKANALQTALDEAASMSSQLDGHEKRTIEQANEIVRLKDDLNKSGSLIGQQATQIQEHKT